MFDKLLLSTTELEAINLADMVISELLKCRQVYAFCQMFSRI